MTVRHKKILELLSGQEKLSVNELSKLLDVSEVTVRSDLNTLSKNGKVERMHGSAHIIEERVKQEYSFQVRKNLNSSIKDKIGRIAAGFVNTLDSILLDSSSTVLALAHALRNKPELKEITVVPTGVWTAIELMGCQNINVLLPGGYLRHTTGSITGLPTSNFLNDIIIQKAFLGAWGISLNNGVTDTHLVEIELKKNIVKRAKEIILLVDGSKFSQTGLAVYADISQLSKVITDSTAPKSEIKNLQRNGVEIIIAK